METLKFSCHHYLLIVLAIALLNVLWISPEYASATDEHVKDYYIVYLGNRPDNGDEAINAHVNLLSSLSISHEEAKERRVYSYTKSFNAFAAKLSPLEARKMMEMEEVLGVFRNKGHKLHTTRSWDFVGLPLTAERNLQEERDVIVGVLDSGITPDSESFLDHGLGPPPAKWKGSCGPFQNFTGCNNKLIGAKYFNIIGTIPPGEDLSPLDMNGHGTHTSSTAAGALVANASLYGLANGTARGAVPSARVAMYKVCWKGWCSDMDILAGLDEAIHDGVDVLSISLGGGPTVDYSTDSISVGSFHAMKNGILTVASAGNSGPIPGTVTNHEPWILTVAASGIDRTFKSRVDLGNGKSFDGTGISMFSPQASSYPLVNGIDVAVNPKDYFSRYCFPGTLDKKKVKGRIVVCLMGGGDTESSVKSDGGAGAILVSDEYQDNAWIVILPATFVNSSTVEFIDRYINSTRSPSAVIQKTREVRIPAPFVASFSSRGPSKGSVRLLKPDIAAPGIDILAAYTLKNSLTGFAGDTQYSKYSILSGTSMSCPHAAGVAAYVKSFHPDWSPAAIKSAIITSATPMSQRVDKDAEFGYGGGQISPRRAVSPGLVYDMDELSYVQFLCAEGYNATGLAPLVGSRSMNCSSIGKGEGHDSINYPTIQLTLESGKTSTTAVFMRRVTNVGPPLSVYTATIRAPEGVEITVEPQSLSFVEVSEKKSFQVEVKAKQMTPGKIVSGLLVWKSPSHSVRSPIVVYSPSV